MMKAVYLLPSVLMVLQGISARIIFKQVLGNETQVAAAYEGLYWMNSISGEIPLSKGNISSLRLISLTGPIDSYNPCDSSTFNSKVLTFSSSTSNRGEIIPTSQHHNEFNATASLEWIAIIDYSKLWKVCGRIPLHFYYLIYATWSAEMLGASGLLFISQQGQETLDKYMYPPDVNLAKRTVWGKTITIKSISIPSSTAIDDILADTSRWSVVSARPDTNLNDYMLTIPGVIMVVSELAALQYFLMAIFTISVIKKLLKDKEMMKSVAISPISHNSIGLEDVTDRPIPVSLGRKISLSPPAGPLATIPSAPCDTSHGESTSIPSAEMSDHPTKIASIISPRKASTASTSFETPRSASSVGASEHGRRGTRIRSIAPNGSMLFNTLPIIPPPTMTSSKERIARLRILILFSEFIHLTSRAVLMIDPYGTWHIYTVFFSQKLMNVVAPLATFTNVASIMYCYDVYVLFKSGRKLKKAESIFTKYPRLMPGILLIALIMIGVILLLTSLNQVGLIPGTYFSIQNNYTVPVNLIAIGVAFSVSKNAKVEIAEMRASLPTESEARNQLQNAMSANLEKFDKTRGYMVKTAFGTMIGLIGACIDSFPNSPIPNMISCICFVIAPRICALFQILAAANVTGSSAGGNIGSNRGIDSLKQLKTPIRKSSNIKFVDGLATSPQAMARHATNAEGDPGSLLSPIVAAGTAAAALKRKSILRTSAVISPDES